MGCQPYPGMTILEVSEFVIHGGRNEKPEGTSNFMYVCTAWGSGTFSEMHELIEAHSCVGSIQRERY